MSIIVTGATGHLGHLVVEELLDRGVPAAEIVATGRNIDTLEDLATRGVAVRRVDFSDPATLEGLLGAGDRLLLVSGSEIGARVSQHQAVIDAAVAAHVAVLVYTSGPRATTSAMQLMTEHRLTEEALAASGLPTVILRNGWYVENYLDQLDTYLEHGAVLGSAGAGRVSAAPRADYAAAAAVVLADPDPHIGHVYELAGDESFTLDDLAATITEVTGTSVVYADMTPTDHEAALVGAGVPAPMAAVFVDVDQATAGGALLVETGDLRRLIGRPTTTLADAAKQAIAART
jgi:NAD(P)H dehydrogenase (quinone)